MAEILLTALPLYLLIAVGAALRLLAADDKWVEIFNKYGLYLGFPAIVFACIIDIPAGGMLDTDIILWNLVLLFILVILSYVIARFLRLSTTLRNTYIISLIFSNAAYLGYPFITSIIEGSETSATIHFVLYLVFLFTVGLFILETSKGKEDASILSLIGNILKSPLLLSVIFGFAFRETGWTMPVFLDRTIDMLAASATPIVLLAIGLFIARRISFDRNLMHASILTAIKLAAVPALFLLLAKWQYSDGGFEISIIDAAMPVGVTAFALAETYPLDKQILATLIVISTIVSAITLPIITSMVL